MRGLVLFALATAVWAQPVVSEGGIRNAALARAGLTGGGVAPGSWFTILGRSLGPSTVARVEGPQLEVAGTYVKISSRGNTYDAPLLAVSSAEILAYLPADVAAGEATLTVVSGGMVSQAAPFRVVASNFGVFIASQRSDTAAIYSSLRQGGWFLWSDLDNPAKPSDEVSLFGTGLGSVESPVEIVLDGQAVEIVSMSKDECCPGIDRVTIRVPIEADGCGLPVQTRYGGAASPVGMLSVASDGRFCADRNGFSAADLEKAKTQGHLKTAYLFLMRFATGGVGAPSFDIGFANFSRVSAELIGGFRNNWSQNIPGACYVATTEGNVDLGGQPGADFFDDFYPFGETPLNAGSNVNVSGPGGQQQMMSAGPGIYTGMFFNPANPLISYFSPGEYTLSASGGEVGSVNGKMRIGPPLNFRQQAMTSVRRDQDYKIEWTGGEPSDRVWAAVLSLEFSGGIPRAGIVSCYQRAKNGALTVPAALLQQLPAPSAGTGGSFVWLYSLGSPQRFDPGGNLDAGYSLSLTYSALPLTLQ